MRLEDRRAGAGGMESVPPGDFPDYPAGSWGPESADLLIAREGHNWLQPYYPRSGNHLGLP